MPAIQRLVQESTAVLTRAAPRVQQAWEAVRPGIANALWRFLAACETVGCAARQAWRSWSPRRRVKVCLTAAAALLAVAWMRGCNSADRRESETRVQSAATAPAAAERPAVRSSGNDAEHDVRQFQVPDKPPTVFGNVRSTDEKRLAPAPPAGQASGRSSEPARTERVTVLRPVQPVSENGTDPWDRLLAEQGVLHQDVDAFVRQLTQELPDNDGARVAMLHRLCSTGALLQELARWRREPGKEYLLDDANRAELQRLTHRWQAWEQAVVSEAAHESATTDH